MATSAEGRADAERWIRDMEARIDLARVAGDVALFEAILAPEFRTTNPVGLVTAKDAMLADTRSGEFRVTASHSHDISVEVFGDAACVRGLADIRARFGGRDVSGTYAYTHLYVRSGEAWQVAAAHTSRLMPMGVYFLAMKVENLVGRLRGRRRAGPTGNGRQ
jgi:hypothetical protein